MFQTIRILKNLWLQPKKDISESLVLLAEFIDSHGRLPRNSAETPEELRLYRFLVVKYIPIFDTLILRYKGPRAL